MTAPNMRLISCDLIHVMVGQLMAGSVSDLALRGIGGLLQIGRSFVGCGPGVTAPNMRLIICGDVCHGGQLMAGSIPNPPLKGVDGLLQIRRSFVGCGPGVTAPKWWFIFM